MKSAWRFYFYFLIKLILHKVGAVVWGETEKAVFLQELTALATNVPTTNSSLIININLSIHKPNLLYLFRIPWNLSLTLIQLPSKAHSKP